MFEFMDEYGRDYNKGEIDKEREDENNVAADREAYIQKIFDRCDQEGIYERGMPFPKEFFMDFVDIALERFAVRNLTYFFINKFLEKSACASHRHSSQTLGAKSTRSTVRGN